MEDTENGLYQFINSVMSAWHFANAQYLRFSIPILVFSRVVPASYAAVNGNEWIGICVHKYHTVTGKLWRSVSRIVVYIR